MLRFTSSNKKPVLIEGKDHNNFLGYAIYDMRLSLGMSQEDLANLSLESLKNIRRYEEGIFAVSNTALNNIAKAMNIDPVVLCDNALKMSEMHSK